MAPSCSLPTPCYSPVLSASSQAASLLPRSETCTVGSQEPYLQDPTYRTRPAVLPSLWLADLDSSSSSSVTSHLSLAYLHTVLLLHRLATSKTSPSLSPPAPTSPTI